MDSRERVRRAFRRELPDRPAFNFWMDRDMLAEYERELGPEFRVTHFGADVIEVFPDVAWWKGLERQARAVSGTVWHPSSTVKRPPRHLSREEAAISWAWRPSNIEKRPDFIGTRYC